MAAKEFVTVDEKGEIIIPKKFIKELGLSRILYGECGSKTTLYFSEN